jgi:tRNA-dihydrouridine synthase
MLRLGPHPLKNPWVLAPMAGVSEEPFRVLAFRMGAALCPTELVSAQGLMRANARTVRYLRHDGEVERPYSVQIFGGEPEVMARAAQVAKEWGAELIDVNMGCPVKKVTRSGLGPCSAIRPAPRIGGHRRGDRPRSPPRSAAGGCPAPQLSGDGRRAGEAGCAGLAVHPRTRAQGYAGEADWRVIADLRRHVRTMTLIGNGDVKSPLDARRMRESTGCDLVMIGRAALGNPWIFRQLLGGPAPDSEERCQVVLGHFRAHLAFVGEPFGAVRSFRKHLAWYAHGLRGAAAFRAEVATARSRWSRGAPLLPGDRRRSPRCRGEG